MASSPPIIFVTSIFLISTLAFAQEVKPHNDTSPYEKAPFACDVDANPEFAKFTFCDQKKPIDERVADLVTRMTLKEKIGYIKSSSKEVERLGIPYYRWWSEALHGVSTTGNGSEFNSARNISGATSFPMPINMAASFNVSLFYAIARAVANEARAMYNVGQAGLTFWSPNINIFRDPRWGRGMETPGEDTLLTSVFGVAYIKGLQQPDDNNPEKLKVAGCCKHLTAYDLDGWKGYSRFTFNSVVSKQDLEETFNPPFKSCVMEGQGASIMCSYNKINGTPACADPDLLKGLVRGQWKLNGYIVSDCNAVQFLYNRHDYAKTRIEAVAMSVNAGLDLDCDHESYVGKFAHSAVNAGLLKVPEIDRAVTNNMKTLMRLGFFDGNPRKGIYGKLGPKDVCTPATEELARETARQGIVLLKNIRETLPLNPTNIKSMAVIGPNGNATRAMIGNYEGIPCSYISPLQGLSASVKTTFVRGCNVTCEEPILDEAKKAAAAADATVLVVGGSTDIEDEFVDREEISLPGEQEKLISEVSKVSKGPVILVVFSGGSMDVGFANTDNNIKGILWAGYPGQHGGVAIADVIFGRYNPSGRLPVTWYPREYTQYSMARMHMRPNKTSGFPGRTYKFYTGPTVYPFGHGLSYTTFDHQIVSAPKVVKLNSGKKGNPKSVDASGRACKKSTFEIRVRVKNTGKMAGGRPILLYSTPPPVHNPPQKMLVAFDKVFLKPQEQAVVKFRVNMCKDMSVVDEQGNRKVAVGNYKLQVAKLNHTLEVRR
ncbi:beta-xylosidase/alpha-L-arabinofuranosidase 2-like [Cornus florida]|uniref:beta-xylosidase/alpha-L-arabinofuranosidase 2-like n=1 Tax=Cornus florida TaxID=4283 RepID=UPI0028A212E3|nr:beta-xylosidase/alpha-L-arabinofuranosidase 2-like [Cornus florida]